MNTQKNNTEFDFKLFFFITKKNLLFIIVFGFVALLSVCFYLRYTAPVYESSSVFQINSDDKAGVLFQTNNIYNNNLSKKIEILRSSVFMKDVLSSLPVDVSVFSKGKLMNTEMYKGAPFTVKYELIDSSFCDKDINLLIKNNKCYASIGNNKETEKEFDLYESVCFPQFMMTIVPKDTLNFYNVCNEKEYIIVFNNLDKLADYYTRKVASSVINDESKTIRISLKDNNSAKSADIVNAIVKRFEKFDIEQQSESAKNILEFIDNQLGIVEESLSNSEDSLKKILPSSIDTAVDKTAMKAKSIELNKEISNRQYEIQSLNNLLTMLNNGSDVISMSSALMGTESHVFVAPYLTNLQQLDIKRQGYLQNMTETSSSVVNLDKQIAYQKRLVRETIVSLINKQNKDLKHDLAEQYRIKQTLGIQSIQESEDKNKIERYYSVNEKFYNQLVEKKIEYSIAIAGYVSQLTILEPAKTSIVPIFPNKRLIWLCSFLFCCIAVVAFLLIKYFTYNEITSLNDVIKITSVPILGVIPKYKRQIPTSQLVVDINPQSLLAESLRSIRANLQFIKNESSPKVIAITSTVSGEGKTFVAINLAGILSYSENNVIVLDFDMRRPKIHLGFSTNNEKGISSILTGTEDIDSCIKKSVINNLHFITAGPEPINPSELILSKRMDDLINYLKTKYSYIIIDNPPIGLVSDSLKCLQYADYPIYVLRANYSKQEYLSNIERLNKESKLANLSVILNSIDPEITSAGSSRGYTYGYGYGHDKSGYYSDDKKENISFFEKILKLFKY